MTVSFDIDPYRLHEEQPFQAFADLLRELLQTFINTPLSTEADAVCGAAYGHHVARAGQPSRRLPASQLRHPRRHPRRRGPQASRGLLVTDHAVRTELLDPTPALALAGLLGVEAPDLDGGAPLPLLWHWLYTLERPAQADLGTDGHPIRGTVPAPPGRGRRRMWAGGSVENRAPLLAGRPLTRRTRVADETVKDGRTGRLTFVTVEHEITQDDIVAVRERQDIVYRDASSISPSPTAAEPMGDEVEPGPDEWDLVIDPVLLFRFSALTYNGHRIHYDRDYATGVEAYPGLVTHGPLQAIVMAETARRRGVDATVGHRFDYRLVSPLYDHQGLVAFYTAGETRVRDRWGRVTATGRLTTP